MVMFIILIKSLEKLELKIQDKINWLIEKEKGKKSTIKRNKISAYFAFGLGYVIG